MAKGILKQNTPIIASVLAFAFGIVALCLVLFHTKPQREELLSVEVSVLAAVATVLIAWQLFTIYNLHKTVNDINRTVDKKIKEAVESCQVPLEGEIAYIRADKRRTHAHDNQDTCAFELAYNYYLDALECFVKYPKTYYHDEILEYIKEIIEVGEVNYWLSEEEQTKGVQIISKTTAKNKNEVLKMLLNVITDRPSCPNIELQVVPNKNGGEHKLIFHNTGDETAYLLRIGFPRKSDEDSVLLRCDDEKQFDELKGDARVVVYVIPKETFNNKLTIRVWYQYGKIHTCFSRTIDFRTNNDPILVAVNDKLESADICTYPSKNH